MLPSPGAVFRKLKFRLYRRSIDNALALYRRNEVRSDGLVLNSLCNRLEICWYARDLHPWDYALSPEQKESAFNLQAMEDTEAAVLRIFERRPEVQIIEVKVLESNSSTLLASGTIQRSALNAAGFRSPSVRMRLGEMGIRYFWAPIDPHVSGAAAQETQASRKIDDRRIA